MLYALEALFVLAPTYALRFRVFDALEGACAAVLDNFYGVAVHAPRS